MAVYKLIKYIIEYIFQIDILNIKNITYFNVMSDKEGLIWM